MFFALISLVEHGAGVASGGVDAAVIFIKFFQKLAKNSLFFPSIVVKSIA